jgi:endonuclease III
MSWWLVMAHGIRSALLHNAARTSNRTTRFAARDISRPAARSAQSQSAALPEQTAPERARLYSEELGIDLAGGREQDLFLWFLASLLFGQRISETIARHTFESFVRHGLTNPQKILAAGWEYLVNPVMREGGYVRYDESKSRKILSACRMLLDLYGGSLARLHEKASDRRDLEQRLLAFYGVGPVTVNIFLRELRPFWRKADPDPLPVVEALARDLGVDLNAHDRKSLAFARVEAGLIRLRHLARRAHRPERGACAGRRKSPPEAG